MSGGEAWTVESRSAPVAACPAGPSRWSASIQRGVRQVEHTVEVGVDGLTTPRQVNERRFLAAVSLLSLKACDPTAHGIGTVGGSTLYDLGVQGCQLAVIEPDGYLRGHVHSVLHHVNHSVCTSSARCPHGCVCARAGAVMRLPRTSRLSAESGRMDEMSRTSDGMAAFSPVTRA